MKRGFDAEKYVEAQSAEILKRVGRFGRLYLEVGGKLLSDDHAARVLPGYVRNCKVKILKRLGDVEIVYCVSAKDLVSTRFVGRYGLTSEEKALKDLHDLKVLGFEPRVVVTRFEREREARDFGRSVRGMRLKVFYSEEIDGYGEIRRTLKGFEKQKLVKLKGDLIVVTGVGGGSGKMGFILSQIYKERKLGNRKNVGFAKFESFPIWDLALSHPVNLAYEAATADLGDENIVDPFHLRAYHRRVVNYNRDVENFHILKRMMRAIDGKIYPFGYRSPTDMGVNMMSVGIVDDGACRRAAVKEIRGRVKEYKREVKLGRMDEGVLERVRGVLGKVR
jgi:uncharacterized protein (UPF0371 family)